MPAHNCRPHLRLRLQFVCLRASVLDIKLNLTILPALTSRLLAFSSECHASLEISPPSPILIVSMFVVFEVGYKHRIGG